MFESVRQRVLPRLVVITATTLGTVAAPVPLLGATPAAAAPTPYVYQVATGSACSGTATLSFVRPTTPGTLLVLATSTASGEGNAVSSPGWTSVGGTYAPGFLFNAIPYVYFNNPGGLTSVTLTHPYGHCQAFTFVEFSATATTGTYDTTRTVTNAYGARVTGMSGGTGPLQQSGELVVWTTGQAANPQSYVPGSGMIPAASSGAPNGAGVSSEVEFTIGQGTAGVTASSSWTTSAAAVATVIAIPVTWPGVACDDGIDNDGDGKVDYPADYGCSSATDSTEAPNPQCSDGIDNDADGRVDYPTDPGCTDFRDPTENSEPQCQDGLDNDADGRADYPADYGCSSATDSTEAPNPQCGDGLDNDADGRVDHPTDPGCTGPRDDSEGVSCTTSSGVTACAGVSTGTEVDRLRVHGVDVVDGTVHTVAGYVDVYRFRLPNGSTVNVPCVVLTRDGSTSNPCADAGGTFVARSAVLVEETVAEPVPAQGAEVTNVGICDAELVTTVNDIGIASQPMYTLC